MAPTLVQISLNRVKVAFSSKVSSLELALFVAKTASSGYSGSYYNFIIVEFP